MYVHTHLKFLTYFIKSYCDISLNYAVAINYNRVLIVQVYLLTILNSIYAVLAFQEKMKE
jgi:hypothetical protein